MSAADVLTIAGPLLTTIASLAGILWRMATARAATEEDIVKIEHAQNGMISIRNLSHVLGVALPDRAE